jgi:hypothetical protein
MKIMRTGFTAVILIALLALGVGFLIYHPAPTPVAEAPAPHEQLPVQESPRGDQWFGSTTTPQGLTFFYPDPFPGRYVTAPEWPPRVELVANAYSCTEGTVTAADGPLKTAARKVINGREYCVTASSEGAAGSTFTTYEYVTDQGGDFVARVVFTIRRVQCMNFDEPERSQCTAEQDAFNPDDMADRIAEGIRML